MTASFANRTRTPGLNCPPEVETAVAAIQQRLTWPSMHWGVEGVSPDAWPHIAAAVLDAVGLERLAQARHWVETCVDPVAIGPMRKQAMLDYLDGKRTAPDFEAMPSATAERDATAEKLRRVETLVAEWERSSARETRKYGHRLSSVLEVGK